MSELLSKWTYASLLEVAKLVRGVTYSKTDLSLGPAKGYLPVLRATNISDAGLVLSDESLVWVAEHCIKDEQLLRNGDALIVASSGSRDVVGRANLFDRPLQAAFGAFCTVLRPHSMVDGKYLSYYLRSEEYRTAVSSAAAGTNINNIKRSFFDEHKLALAPFNEQQRIVAALDERLSELDAALASLDRAERNLSRYRAAVLAAACSGRLVPTEAELAKKEGRGYESADKLLERILAERRKASTKTRYEEPSKPETGNLPKLPEGWTWSTLPMLGELNRGKSKHRPRDDKRLYGGKYPFIQTGDVRHSRGSITNWTQTYSDFGLSQSRQWPIGTLCITIAANIADTGILKMAACFPDSVVGFLPDEGIATDYIRFFIMTAKERIERYAPATAQKNINLDILEKVAVPLPPRAEQERIVDEVERHLTRADALGISIAQAKRRAQRLRRAILATAFHGRLVPQDPKDEPASVLLDRIRAKCEAAKDASPTKQRGRPPGHSTATPRLIDSPSTPKRRGRPPGRAMAAVARSGEEASASPKRRGRPPGSKNRPK